MTLNKGRLFWGYIDDQGKVFVMKYTNDRVIRNYESMPFVKGIFDPFYAQNMQQARMLVYARYVQELH